MKTRMIATAAAAVVLALSSAAFASEEAPRPGAESGRSSDAGAQDRRADHLARELHRAIQRLERCEARLCGADRTRMEEALRRLQAAEQRIAADIRAGNVQQACRELGQVRRQMRAHEEQLRRMAREIRMCVRLHRRTMKRVETFVRRHPGAAQRFAQELARLQRLDASLTGCERELSHLHQQIRQTVSNLKTMAQQHCQGGSR